MVFREIYASSELGNTVGILSLLFGILGVWLALDIKRVIDNKDSTLKKLLGKTKNGSLCWNCFYECSEKEAILAFLEERSIPCDFGMNSVRETQSFYLENPKGYILLLEIYHGDPDVTSPELDTIALVVFEKSGKASCLSDFEKIEQRKLYKLKDAILKVDSSYQIINEILNK